MIKVAILGYGTVGSGVVEVLTTNAAIIAKRAGQEVGVKYVLDLRDFPGDPIQSKVVHDFQIILDDPEVDIVVETMGGTKPAYEFVKKALLAGKSVCTSNKELVAAYGAELVHLAKSKSVNFLFEASVGGGIPVIRPLNQSLTADKILKINGILNGTTNYILTKMAKEGSDFDVVLKEAQELGYAEKDPTADVEGYDACRKIAILSSLAHGRQVDFEDIPTEGITRITKSDISYAKKLEAGIKLIGSSKKRGSDIYASVAPMMLKNTHPLMGVNDVFNAIFVTGNMLGDVMFYGAGAGSLPTASAVVSDVVEAAKNLGRNVMEGYSGEKLTLADSKQAQYQFFVRIKGAGKEEEVKKTFGEVTFVSIPQEPDETAFLTGYMKECDFEAKISLIGEIVNRIRAEF